MCWPVHQCRGISASGCREPASPNSKVRPCPRKMAEARMNGSRDFVPCEMTVADMVNRPKLGEDSLDNALCNGCRERKERKKKEKLGLKQGARERPREKTMPKKRRQAIESREVTAYSNEVDHVMSPAFGAVSARVFPRQADLQFHQVSRQQWSSPPVQQGQRQRQQSLMIHPQFASHSLPQPAIQQFEPVPRQRAPASYQYLSHNMPYL